MGDAIEYAISQLERRAKRKGETARHKPNNAVAAMARHVGADTRAGTHYDRTTGPAEAPSIAGGAAPIGVQQVALDGGLHVSGSSARLRAGLGPARDTVALADGTRITFGTARILETSDVA